MEKYFEEQIKLNKPIGKENSLKGKSLYSEYQEDDIILFFIEQCKTMESNDMYIKTIAKRELHLLEKEFVFLRKTRSFPVLKRKER